MLEILILKLDLLQNNNSATIYHADIAPLQIWYRFWKSWLHEKRNFPLTNKNIKWKVNIYSYIIKDYCLSTISWHNDTVICGLNY